MISTYFRYLRIWSIVLVMVVFPCAMLYQIDSMIKYQDPIGIIQDMMIITVIFYILAILFAVVSCVVVLVVNQLRITKLNTILDTIIICAAVTCAIYTVLGLLNKYVTSLQIFAKAELPYQLKLVIILSIFVLLVKHRNIYIEYFAKARVAFSKVIFIIILLLLIIMPVRYAVENNKLVHIRSIRSVYNCNNVILITCDALTAENMSLYGYQFNTTSNIDKLGGNSYVFKNMYSNGNWTRPSVASILSGKLPNNHRLISMSPYNIYGNIGNSIPSILKLNGYNNIAVVPNLMFAHPLVNEAYPYFDSLPYKTIDWNWIQSNHKAMQLYNLNRYAVKIKSISIMWLINYINEGKLLNKIMNPGLFIDESSYKTTPYRAEFDYNIAQHYLETAKKPFFLWVHIYPPHSPYLPPKGIIRTLLPSNELTDKRDQDAIIRKSKFEAKDFPLIQKLKLRYDENIVYSDKAFGDFLNFLKIHGFYDNSIIILTADHGEAFDHNVIGHETQNLYQSLIHIPLLIHLPGQKYGKSIYHNSQQIDIAPTIAELLGISIPSDFEGNSLVKYMMKDEFNNNSLYSMQLEGNGLRGKLNQGTVATISGNYKYIYNIATKQEQLYDIKIDRFENANLLNRERTIATKMHEQIFDKILRQK